jgi:hypothetical protein
MKFVEIVKTSFLGSPHQMTKTGLRINDHLVIKRLTILALNDLGNVVGRSGR